MNDDGKTTAKGKREREVSEDSSRAEGEIERTESRNIKFHVSYRLNCPTEKM